MEPLAGLFRAARDLQNFCQGNQWNFCFIGGLALQRWGEPSSTQDADLTLLTNFQDEEKFIDALLSRFSARRPDAREFALRYRVLLLQHESGVGLDVAVCRLRSVA
jgi:hypothetical protein